MKKERQNMASFRFQFLANQMLRERLIIHPLSAFSASPVNTPRGVLATAPKALSGCITVYL